ncbi:glycosyltransferase family 2 protein [Vibrio ulleungensis]|uniref:Glycosyltransferase family 2 protein n=1 Tax=Vibrio ulleungensis TaxID=2807619 RepID=A0ABS2HPA1_9VIBR|nr:glycosyltransferase family A protein [Vibrio ulleungensis]MBM7037696.1 glycosyltransferase family 2 protein [Vibrio ulleungensis]
MINISVFTPTYNRVESLTRLYQSLKQQSYKKFTWVIVDDGSIDTTKSTVATWVSEGTIDIKYYYQSNAGKQRAYNLGIEKSEGDLFICIDSDDIYIDSAFAIIVETWRKIANKNDYIAISYPSKSFNGKLIGTMFPKDFMSEYHFIMHNYNNIEGDKGMAFDLRKLKKFRFPVIPGEKFMTEALLYNRLSIRYKTKYINQALEVKEYLNDGLSSKYRSLLINNPLSSALYYSEFRYHRLSLKLKVKSILYEMRYLLHYGSSWIRIIESHTLYYTIPLLPLAIILYCKDLKNEK